MISNPLFSRLNLLSHLSWKTTVMVVLAFWLSGSFVLDFAIMPGMYSAGMMSESGFASTGYSIFGLFNRVELLCAAIALTGFLALSRTHPELSARVRRYILLAGLLLAIALVDTYALAPAMSGLGLQLQLFAAHPIPSAMNSMHGGYFVLEILKLGIGGVLLSSCCDESQNDQTCVM